MRTGNGPANIGETHPRTERKHKNHHRCRPFPRGPLTGNNAAASQDATCATCRHDFKVRYLSSNALALTTVGLSSYGLSFTASIHGLGNIRAEFFPHLIKVGGLGGGKWACHFAAFFRMIPLVGSRNRWHVAI